MINIPFNHQPVDTLNPSSGYTIPAGKYGRLVATLSATARILFSNADDLTSSSNNFAVYNNDSDSTTVEIWLKSGDVITKVTSGGDESSTAVSGSLVAGADAELRVNNARVAEVSCTASAFWNYLSTNYGVTHRVFGQGVVYWHLELYNEIS